jgi:alkane 1-monooxygenase
VPVQWGVALFGLYVLSHEPLTGSAMSGLILSLSVSVGIGVVVAHELCHHASKFDRFMGVLLFTPTNMADFHLYHNIGHHNLVATPDDPASARYNEPVYPFVLRCIVDKSRLAWRIGRDSMAVRGLPL